ncbi:hypothetical protein [Clostridium colicanis]|nr:hypothetical protein [Clostridium colicanis]
MITVTVGSGAKDIYRNYLRKNNDTELAFNRMCLNVLNKIDP